MPAGPKNHLKSSLDHLKENVCQCHVPHFRGRLNGKFLQGESATLLLSPGKWWMNSVTPHPLKVWNLSFFPDINVVNSMSLPTLIVHGTSDQVGLWCSFFKDDTCKWWGLICQSSYKFVACPHSIRGPSVQKYNPDWIHARKPSKEAPGVSDRLDHGAWASASIRCW